MKAVPNILSIFRICLAPVFVFAYFLDPRDIKIYALIIFGIASLSDLLDGYIARKYDAQSNLGKVLDPLGDKLMTFTVIICLTYTTRILIVPVLVFFVKELLQGIGGLVIHKVAKTDIPPANFFGKATTVVFFLVCVTLMVARALPNHIALMIMSFAILLNLISLATYIVSYAKIMKARDKSKNRAAP